ncbi:MAG: hypothetical protein U5K54_24090 [Cytophagales bacterium]|nr:hypothetical protein [Cytophagales bacterium]
MDNDGLLDLLVAWGTGMPITSPNSKIKWNLCLMKPLQIVGFIQTNGWWNTIYKTDLDGDGDFDFLVGNAGTNSRLRVTEKEPLELHISDIDLNGSYDPIITYYNNHQKYPFVSRDHLLKQVPTLKKKYLMNENFKNVSLENILTPGNEVLQKEVETFHSVWIENKEGTYAIHPLPIESTNVSYFFFFIG